MIKEAIEKILSLAPPTYHKVGGPDGLAYADRSLTLIVPPAPVQVNVSTLQGLVDLHDAEMDDAKAKGDLLVHITSPQTVELISRESDKYGRRRTWAKAAYPQCQTFPFGSWQDPETFIIASQQHFQRAKVETRTGGFEHDLDYVLQVASKISAQIATEHDDDGFTQRVAMKQGVQLKQETILKPMVNLAPYRTFAEIDQVLSQFVFRARPNGTSVTLALFEGDGGRWKISAVSAIKSWLEPKFGDVPIIS